VSAPIWGKLRPLMAAWFTFSICLVIVAPFIIFVSLPFGVLGRVLHSFTSQLNSSAFYGIGGARRGCVARVKGVFWACKVFLCVRHGSS